MGGDKEKWIRIGGYEKGFRGGEGVRRRGFGEGG